MSDEDPADYGGLDDTLDAIGKINASPPPAPVPAQKIIGDGHVPGKRSPYYDYIERQFAAGTAARRPKTLEERFYPKR
jgi:hypothetical protein